jgi:hypothetical protein
MMEIRGHRYDAEKAASQWPNDGLVEIESDVVPRVVGDVGLVR